MLDARKKPTQDIVKLSATPKKQNSTPCHQNHEYLKFSNLKTTLFICCCCQPLPCNPWWFLNPMNPIHLPKILKSSLKKVHKSNPSSYYSFIPFNHYDPYLWLSFLNIQPFAPTHISLQKNPNSLKKNPSLKNISWPVPLTSFGPRFKRKKKNKSF